MLKSPYPYFGGKSSVASVVWNRFGDVPNYVEPIFWKWSNSFRPSSQAQDRNRE